MITREAYKDCISWLFEQFPSYQIIGSKAYKPTLNNTSTLLEHLGNPHKALKFVHIAGSNGKGSVSALIASNSTESNYKTGLFTSPHIKDFRERIRIDGECISEQEVISFVDRIRQMDLSFAPSFFEVSFAMAIDHFSRNHCDICVIETGLGGRLDATNIIHPEISIITTISLEHKAILGDTPEEIAREKGGIIKRDVPVVLGNIIDAPRQVLVDCAIKSKSPLYISSSLEIDPSLKGLPFLQVSYQQENLRTALCSLKILNNKGWDLKSHKMVETITNIRKNTGYFGRFDIISTSPLIIYDVSHNAEGIQATLNALSNQFSGQLHIVHGTSSDKDLSEIVQLFPSDAAMYLCEFSNQRSAKLEDLREVFSKKHFQSTTYWNTPEDALSAAREASKSKDCILVTGSFFLVAEFY